MKRQLFKVIHVELKEPYHGKYHYYFGSKAAIYDTLPIQVIGIKLESLWAINLEQKEYNNKLCTIRAGIHGRAKKKIAEYLGKNNRYERIQAKGRL